MQRPTFLSDSATAEGAARSSPILSAEAERATSPGTATVPSKRRRIDAPATWLLLDPTLSLHAHPSRRHRDCPERILSLVRELRASGLAERCRALAADEEASDDDLALVHSPFYVQRLAGLAGKSAAQLLAESQNYDDVFLNEHSVRCARLGAGGVLRMAQALWDGAMRNGFAGCARRATTQPHMANGFCIFNSVAIAARKLLAQGAERVLIVDRDVHHGDGTQRAFLDDPRVLFSVHRRLGVFPTLTRRRRRRRARRRRHGRGRRVHRQPRVGRRRHGRRRVRSRVAGAAPDQRWQPQATIVSAGFDAAAGDPLGDCAVSPGLRAHDAAAARGDGRRPPRARGRLLARAAPRERRRLRQRPPRRRALRRRARRAARRALLRRRPRGGRRDARGARRVLARPGERRG